MIAYSYDSITKQYIGTRECQRDPLETRAAGYDVWLLPANSTFEVPPEEKDGFDIFWEDDEWVYKEIPKAPEPYVPTLEDIKQRKITELKRVRDEKELEPVEYDNHYFDFDLKSYNRITAALDVLDKAEAVYQAAISNLSQQESNEQDNSELTEEELAYLQEIESSESESEEQSSDNVPERPGIIWTTADNENVKLTADGLHGIIQAAATRSNELHMRYRQLKEAVNNANDIPAVQAITWDNLENYV